MNALPSTAAGRPIADGATPIRLVLGAEAETQRLGEALAMMLRAGDVVTLQGDLGAGKSTLARALIRSLAGEPALEVPSPTYTLVQTYETSPPVAHLDLYRLGDPAELDELGFEELAGNGIVLCEWPERAPQAFADAALQLELVSDGAGRLLLASGRPEALDRLARSLALTRFLETLPAPVTERRRLFGDASIARRYETARYGGEAVIVMDAPARPLGPPIRDGLPYSRLAHLAEDVVPFVAVDMLLRARGLAAPRILAADLGQGFLVIEHLGIETMLGPDGAPVPERYEATALVLAELHGAPVDPVVPVAEGLTHTVPPFDRTAMGIEVELLLDWSFPDRFGRPATDAERERFLAVWNDLFARLDETETSILLRDVHSPNVIWRGEREGTDRVGLIDFQDAMIGPTAYDLASLAQDARVDIAPELEARLVASYCAARRAQGSGFDAEAFEEAYAIMAAQRATKILGIFVRLEKRDGKPYYRRHLPRLQAYLRRTITHPALASLRELYDEWGVLIAPDHPKG
ncbi:tRNA (adenosine(37)-N6)-threonylcarbamoyltransferase complex ATPase subunit type 1 TsaE [Aureimonas leprariae]|uniref:tRNA threonylcarbamoyladenosine biosynthesis protein TsaE n=1 Tax=Plantimonas leprariae TaxID=2615207 RepID=A0A7V7PTE0_9HYPH|nr:tRNA (adenosine(37)-N6)-threonylcarbamoyltransferase complex ATPase subunit type 1 TsaE [Aureimonas leprariae]KAB0682893.1 tRNA (adenosine(37)-N6)-threonylcarbamoyltransferase complex ATPase subunit type 1 TsaE [Aureimonas leprariae]